MARERQGGNTPRDKVNQQYPHALQIGLLVMGDGGGELPLRGGCGGVAGGGGLTGQWDG